MAVIILSIISAVTTCGLIGLFIYLWRSKKKENIVDVVPEPIIDNSEKIAELNRLNAEILAAQDNLKNYYSLNSEYAKKYNEVIELYNNLHKIYVTLADERHSVEMNKIDIENQIQTLQPQLSNYQNELTILKERHREAALRDKEEDDGLWELTINDHEDRLISILQEIKINYPELVTDISTIEWKRIWLPKLQDLGNREQLSTKGIYRLVLKENPQICYVGQAVSIQDRWYQHVKKMIGVEPKGYEKLYNYRPEDFYWSVIETAQGGNFSLNEAEKYWIEFYGCKEVGLNKKL